MTRAVTRPCCFKRRRHACPPLRISPRGSCGYPGPGALPSLWRAFLWRGGPRCRGGAGGKCVCWRGKASRFRSAPAKEAVTLRRAFNCYCVFLFSEGRAPIPRARLQCGTGWLWLVAVRQLQPRRSRLPEAQSRRQHLLPACHPRTKDAGG